MRSCLQQLPDEQVQLPLHRLLSQHSQHAWEPGSSQQQQQHQWNGSQQYVLPGSQPQQQQQQHSLPPSPYVDGLSPLDSQGLPAAGAWLFDRADEERDLSGGGVCGWAQQTAAGAQLSDSVGIGRLFYLRSPAAAPHGLGGSVMGGFKVQSLKTCAYASVTSSVGSKGLSKGLTCSVCSCSVLTSAPNSVCVPCRQQARAGQQRECRLGPTSQAPTVRADSLRACLTAAVCVVCCCCLLVGSLH